MMLRNGVGSLMCKLNHNRRWNHLAFPAPLERVMDIMTDTEFHGTLGNNRSIEAPTCDVGGSIELMAVPKKTVSPYKKSLRNGPKALKPVPVIICCKSCGRVKLPHFYCCSGDRGSNDRNDSSG